MYTEQIHLIYMKQKTKIKHQIVLNLYFSAMPHLKHV